MNALYILPNAVIETLENKEKNIKIIKDYLKRSKPVLLNVHRQGYGKSEFGLIDLHIEKAFNKSLAENNS